MNVKLILLGLLVVSGTAHAAPPLMPVDDITKLADPSRRPTQAPSQSQPASQSTPAQTAPTQGIEWGNSGKWKSYTTTISTPSPKPPETATKKPVCGEKYIYIGMNKDEFIACREAINSQEPNKINSTITANGKHEQWIYRSPKFEKQTSLGKISFGGDEYYYFTNDILTAIQE